MNTAKELTDKRLKEREEDLSKLNKNIEDEKILSQQGRKKIENELKESNNNMMSRKDEVDKRFSYTASKVDVNSLENRLKHDILISDKTSKDKIEINKNEILSNNNRLNTAQRELYSLKKSTEEGLQDRKKEIVNLQEYVNLEKKLTAREIKLLDDALSESMDSTLKQINNVEDRVMKRAMITDVNFMESQLNRKIINLDQESKQFIQKNSNQISEHETKLTSNQSEIKSVQEGLNFLKKVLIYSGIAIGILIIVIPATTFFVIKSKIKRVTPTANGNVNDAYL